MAFLNEISLNFINNMFSETKDISFAFLYHFISFNDGQRLPVEGFPKVVEGRKGWHNKLRSRPEKRTSSSSRELTSFQLVFRFKLMVVELLLFQRSLVVFQRMECYLFTESLYILHSNHSPTTMTFLKILKDRSMRESERILLPCNKFQVLYDLMVVIGLLARGTAVAILQLKKSWKS